MPSSCFPVEKRRDLAIWDKTECLLRLNRFRTHSNHETTVRNLLEDVLETVLICGSQSSGSDIYSGSSGVILLYQRECLPILVSHLGLSQLCLSNLSIIYSKPRVNLEDATYFFSKVQFFRKEWSQAKCFVFYKGDACVFGAREMNPGIQTLLTMCSPTDLHSGPILSLHLPAILGVKM